MPLSDLDTPEVGETDEIPPPSAASPSLTRPLASGSLASGSLASLARLEAPQEPEVLNDEEEFGLPSHVLAIALGDLDEPAEAEADPLGETSAPWPVVLGTVHSLSQDPGLFSQIEVEEDDWSCLEAPPRLSASFHHPNVSQDPVGKETLIREAVWEDPRIQCPRLSLPKIDDLAHVNSRGRVDLKRLKRTQPQLFCRRPTRKTTPAAKPKKPRPRAPPAPTAVPAPALSAVLVQYSSSDSEDSELEALRQKHRPVAALADHPSPSPRASQAWKRPRSASTPQSEPDPPCAKRKKTQTGGRPRVRRPPAAVVSHSDDAETVPNPPPVVRDSDATVGERVADSPTDPTHPPSVGRPGVIPPSPGAPPSPPAPSPVPPPIAVPDQLEVNRHAHDDEAWHEPGPLNLAFFDSTHDLRKFKKLLLVELHHHCEFLGKKAPGISFSALERRIQSAMDRIKAQKPLIPARPSPASPATPLNGPDQRLRLGAGIKQEVRIQLSDVRKVGSLHEKAFQLAWPHFERSLERRARQRQESLSFCLKMIKKFLDTRELYSRAKRESEDKRKDRGRNRKILSDDSESNDDGDKAKSKSNATSQRQDSPDHPGSENAKTKSSSHITQMGKGFKIPKAEGKSKDQSKETTMKSILKEEPMKTNSKGQAPANAKNPLSKQYNHSYQKSRDSNPSRPSANKKPAFSSAAKGTPSFDLLNVVSGMKNSTKKKEPRTDPRIRELQNRPQSKNGPHSDTSYQSRHRHNSHIANGKRGNSLGQNKADRLPLKFIGDDEVDEVLSRRMRDPNGQDFSTVIAWREPGLSPIMFKCRVCNLQIQGKGDLMHHVVGFRHHTNFKCHTALPPRDRPKTALDRPKSAMDRPSNSVGDATPPGDDYRNESPTPGAGQSIEAQPPVMNILPVPSQVWDMPKFSLPLPVPSLPKPVPSTRPSCDSVTPGSFTSSTSPMQSSTEATRPRSFIPGLPTPIPVPVATPVPVRNPDSHSPTPAPSPSLAPSPKPGSPAVKPGLSKADLEKLPPPMKMSERVKNHLSRAHMHANVNPLEGDQPLNGPNDQDEGECEEAHLNKTEPKTEKKQPDTKPKGNDTPEGGYYEPGDQTPIWNPPSATASDQAKGSVKPASESFGEFNIETSKSFLNETHQNVEDEQSLLDSSKIQVKDMNTLINPVESDPAMLIGQDFSSILNKVIHTLAKSTKGPVDVRQTPPPSSDPPPPPLPATEVLQGPSPPLSETPLNPLTDSNLTRVPSTSNPHEAEAEVVNQYTSYLGANHSSRAAAEAGASASSQLKYHSNSSEVIAPPPPPRNPRQDKDMRRPSGSISDVEINSFMNQWCHQPPAQPTTSTELVTPSASAHKEPVLSSALAKLRARKAQKKAAQAEVSSSTGGRSSPLGSDISECSNASGQNFLPGNQYSRQYPPPPPPLPPLPPSAHYQHQHQPQQRQPYPPSYHSGVGNGWGGAQPPLPPIPPPPLSIPPSSSYLHPFPSHYQQPPLPPSQQTFRPR